MSETDSSSAASGKSYTWMIWVLAVVALFAAARYFNVQDKLKLALDWIDGLGPLGPIIFIALYVVATVLLIPGSILTLGAGAVFGVVKGSILVSIAATLGATAAFFVGRYLARDWVGKKIEGKQAFAAIDKGVAEEGWKIVGLTRLSPVFPFTLLNYAYGVTKVNAAHYVIASWAGMIPGTIMYVYLGSIAKTAAEAGETSTAEWTLRIVGLLATIAVTVVITRTAKKALNQKTDLDEADVE